MVAVAGGLGALWLFGEQVAFSGDAVSDRAAVGLVHVCFVGDFEMQTNSKILLCFTVRVFRIQQNIHIQEAA